MKKLFLGLGATLLLGAGCLSNIGLGSKDVEGSWYLAFNLPEGWIMVEPYNSGDITDPGFKLNQEVTQSMNAIILQGTNKAIYGSTGALGDGISELIDAGKVEVNGPIIEITLLDERRVIPSEAEDIGDGFSRVKLCEDGDECQIGGQLNYDYYLETAKAKYKFDVSGLKRSEAEDIITSAKEVTTYTGPQAEIEVE